MINGKIPLKKSNRIVSKSQKSGVNSKRPIQKKMSSKIHQENVFQGSKVEAKVEEKLISIPIKVNVRKNIKVDYKIPEITTPEAELNLFPCKDCGRSFVKEALQRHQKICKKIFINKRKEFNSAKQRF